MDRYEPQQPWLPASEGIMDWGEDFHALMLGDRVRMDAFRAAIAETVHPGAIVVDLGTGTGILAQWSLRAGASRVYGIEFNETVLSTATERLAAAGLGDRFFPVPGLSFDIDLPEPADVIISETLGNLADNEGCVPILADARTRFLRPTGVIMPSAVETYLVPVAAEQAHNAITTGAVRGGPAPDPFGTYYDAIIPATCHLAAPRLLRHYRWAPDESDEYQLTRVFPVHRPGLFTGLKGYFIADLSPTVALDISGDDVTNGSTSDSWKHCYLPIRTPIPVHRGDRIALTFTRSTLTPFRQRYRWAGTVLRDQTPAAHFDHSSGPGP